MNPSLIFTSNFRPHTYPDKSPAKTTYDEFQIAGGIDPCACDVIMILNDCGSAANCVSNFCPGSGSNGSTVARCRNIGKILSAAGAAGASRFTVRNCSSAFRS